MSTDTPTGPTPFAQETLLGQIFLDGRWRDYARTADEQSARQWVAADPQRRRVVDWIFTDRVLIGEGVDDGA